MTREFSHLIHVCFIQGAGSWKDGGWLAVGEGQRLARENSSVVIVVGHENYVGSATSQTCKHYVNMDTHL